MARSFNGSSDKLTVASGFGFSAFPMTISVWFNASALTGDHTLVSVGTNDVSNYVQLLVRSTGAIRARQQTSASIFAATTTATVSAGGWHHAAATYVANNSRSAFLDGANKATETSALSGFGNARTKTGIGVLHLNTDSSFFQGSLAEIGIWNVTLTDAEIALLGKGVSPLKVRPDALVAYIPVLGKTSPEIELVSGNSFTVTGTSETPHPRIYNAYGQPYEFTPSSGGNVTTTKTQTGVARVQQIVTKTQAGVSKMLPAGTASYSIEGKANIQSETVQRTQSGKARITNSNDKVTVNTGTSYQTFNGWQVSGETGSGDYLSSSVNWHNTALDLAVEMGVNRARIGLMSGYTENSTDYWAAYVADGNDFSTNSAYSNLTNNRRVPVNDNADPNSINASGFKWSHIDWQIDNIIIPLKNRLEARGETLWWQVTYVHFATTNQLHIDDPDEYGELILATWQHIQNTYGFLPDGLEILLEPNGTPAVTEAELSAMTVAARDRLVGAGFTKPVFTAPSGTGGGNSLTFYNNMTSTAKSYIEELGYHLYQPTDNTNRTSIYNQAVTDGKITAMNEYGGGTMHDLHNDLTHAHVSVWEQYAISYPLDDGYQLFTVGASPTFAVTETARAKYLRHYYKFIRRNAVMKGVTNSGSTFLGVAFENANNTYIAVIKCTAGGTFEVEGLPAGTYAIKKTVGNGTTSPSSYWVSDPTVTIESGQNIPVTISGAGVVTVFNVGFQPTQQAQTGKANIVNAQETLSTDFIEITFSSAVTTKTQTGVSRIQKTAAQTQTGVSRIQVTSSAIQVGVARITSSVQQTQDGKSAIQNTSTQLQGGVSRVTAATQEIQSGVSRIQKTAAQTQTGVSRIQKSAAVTQTGLSRIQVSTASIQTGVSRITSSVQQTQLGEAVIRRTALQTQAGTSRIQKAVQLAQVGVSRIQHTVTSTQTGLSRITAFVQATQLGKAAVRGTAIQTQSGVALLTGGVQKVQSGVASIRVTSAIAQVGLSRIQQVVVAIQTGLSRIQRIVSQVQGGTSRITASSQRTQVGRAAIQKGATKVQTGISKVTAAIQKNQIGKAAIEQTASFVQLGIARVRKIEAKVQVGISRIGAVVQRTQVGTAAILKTVTHTQIGTARIGGASQALQIGKAAIRNSAAKTQAGISRIGRLISVVQTGLARITGSVQRSISGVSRVATTQQETQAGVSRVIAATSQTQVGTALIQKQTQELQLGKAFIILGEGAAVPIRSITYSTLNEEAQLSSVLSGDGNLTSTLVSDGNLTSDVPADTATNAISGGNLGSDITNV